MADRQQSAETRSAGAGAIPHWYSPDSELVEVVEGEGARVYDADGNEYLDCISQLYCVNAGHGNRAIVDAMAEQLDRVQYVSPAKRNDARDRLAARLAEIAPGSLSEVFFSVSGSEANEAAIQFARAHRDAPKILTRWRSYHGATYAAGGLTGDPETRTAVESHASTTGTVKFLPPVAYRGPFAADTPEELAAEAADHLEFVIRNEGPDSVAAILTEPVAGTSGAYTAPADYFERVREICDEYDVLLIADEVITGFGRCGDWFGIDTEGVEPDMITFAKGVTSAYAPLAGVLARPDVGEALREEGIPVGQTFGGHPVSCAAGVAAVEEYRGGLLGNVRDLAPYLAERLRDLQDDHAEVGDVRGRGLHWGVEFTDPETGEPFVHPWVDGDDNPVADVIEAAQERGALLGGGRPNFQLLVSPPFVVDEADIDEMVEVLDAAIADVF